MPDKRREGETLDQYHARLKTIQKLEKKIAKGVYIRKELSYVEREKLNEQIKKANEEKKKRGDYKDLSSIAPKREGENKAQEAAEDKRAVAESTHEE